MHVSLVRNGVAADSSHVARGETADCTEVTYEIKLDRPPDDVWLSFFYNPPSGTEPRFIHRLTTRKDLVKFWCRGDEVDYAIDELKRLVQLANSAFYEEADCQVPVSHTTQDTGKHRRDREYAERAERML